MPELADMDSIVAVVVTYNRLALLKQCIQALKNQTVHLNAVIVVNNGSTDGTAEWLDQQQELTIIHQGNLGGAGGFHAGMQAAYTGGYDWVWIMDDDAFPQSNCLQQLLNAKTALNNNDIVLAPVVVENDKIDYLHRGFITSSNLQHPLQQNLSEKEFLANDTPIIEVTFTSFIGMFMGRKIIETVGYPVLNYYIFNDDVEYSIRIKKNNFPVYLVKEAIIYHKVNKTGTFTAADFGHIKRDKIRTPKSRMFHLWRNRYVNMSGGDVFRFIGERNWLRTIITHYGISFQLLYILAKKVINVAGYTLFSKANNRTVLSLYYTAFRQGVSGKFNNDSFFLLREKLKKAQ